MTAPNNRERILPRLIDDEIKESFINYSMSVIVSRALPDVRDGLKPVHRRVLFAMNELGLVPGRPYKKSATVVGDVLGKYHPHGDMSVYDAIVRMVQDFSLRYPLVDGQGNWGCFTGDTRIKLLDGTERTLAELAELPHDQIFHVYSVDASGSIEVGEGRSSRVTRRRAVLVELTFDDGSTVRCTPDHRFMLRDGTWKHAVDLTIDDSLMAGHFDTAPVNARTNDYLRVRQPVSGEWEFVHHVADRFNASRGCVSAAKGPFVRHHCNFNRFDNRPNNIVRMEWLEHLHLHAQHLRDLWQREEFRAEQRAGAQAHYVAHPEAVEANRARLRARNTSSDFRSVNGPRVARALKTRFAEHPELAADLARRMRRLWQDPDYRLRMCAVLQGIEKRPLTDEQRRRVSRVIGEKSRAMWQDHAKRAVIVEAIVTALRDPARRAVLSERSRRLWLDPEYRGKYAEGHHARMAATLWSDPRTADLHRRRVMRTKIAGYTSRLLAEVGLEGLSPAVFDACRSGNWVPKSGKAAAYFGGFAELLDAGRTHNHRVVRVRPLDEPADVYDITVNEHHNFMLANGCVVSNSADGDNAAAYRYTEARLTRVATELLADIDKNTVDFAPNFDDRLQEPKVLPSGFPNLIVNGSSGIAVGMATNIPPHNLREVIDAVVALIDNPEMTTGELMKIVKGPDFPTGGYIYGRQGIKDYQETGRGRIVMRARAVIEERESGGRAQIVVTELPYQVSGAKLEEVIRDLVNEKKLEGITAMRNETNREGRRIVLELRRDAIPRVVLNQLYKHTPMQATFGVIMLALVPDPQTQQLVPKVMALKELLTHYITHRHEVVVRRSQFELDKALEREHILEGLKIAVDNIDEVVKLIRKAEDTPQASTRLQARFKLSERQAEAILNMRLAKLTGLEIDKLEAELKDVRATIKELRALLESRPRRMRLIKEELGRVAEAYGDERRSEITSDEGEFTIEDLIAEEDMVITVSHSGYIKRTAVSTYRRQRRGGRGLSGQDLKDHDFIEHLFIGSTHDHILFFTDDGRCFKLKVHEIPQAGRATKGRPIVNLINVSPDTSIKAMLPVTEFSASQYLLFCTKNGTVKKTALSEYANPRTNGIKAIKVDAGDELIDVQVTSGTNDVILATRHGLSVRFHESDVREMGRDTTGVKGIELREGDAVVGMVVIRREATILVVTENGMGKCSHLEEYRVQRRGGKGIITVNRTEKTGDVVAVMEVLPADEIMLITMHGLIIRSSVAQVRVTGRIAQGVKLVQLDAGDRVTAVARVVPEEADGAENGETASPTPGATDEADESAE